MAGYDTPGPQGRTPPALLLAEELLLLLLDDESGALRIDGTSADYALSGAVLTELALAERVHVTPKQGWFGSSRVDAEGGTAAQPAVSDPVLERALEQIQQKPRSAEKLVPALSKGLRRALSERLVQRELVRHDDDRVLGIFPRSRFPAVDGRVEEEIRGRVRRVLLGGAVPDPRTAALVGLLSAVEQAHKVVGDVDRATAKQVRARAREIAAGDWVPQAVRSAVQAAQAAVAAAVIAATTAASTSAT